MRGECLEKADGNKYLFGALRKNAGSGALSALLLIADYTAPIAYAQLLKLIINAVSAEAYAQIPPCLAWAACVACLHIGCNVFSRYAGTVFEQAITRELRAAYVEKVSSATLAELQSRGLGELLSVYNTSLNGLSAFAARQIPMFLAVFVSFASGLGYTFQIHILLAAACVFPSIVTLLYVNRESRLQAAVQKEYAASVSALSGCIADCMAGRAEIVSNNAQGIFLERFREASAANRELRYRSERIENKIFYFSAGQHNFTMVLVLAVGGLLFFRGIIPAGDVIAAYSIFFLLSNPMRNVARYVAQWRKGMTSRAIFDGVMSMRDERAGGAVTETDAARVAPAIKMRLERFAYGSGAFALSGVDFEIPQGACAAMAAPSGAGKSTLAKLLAGYSDDYRGSVQIMGLEAKEADLRKLRESVLYVNSVMELTSATVSVLFERMRGSGASAAEALKIADLTDTAEAYGGEAAFFNLPLKDNAANLSGGERQRLIIALAVMRGAEIFIFDEMLSAVGYGQRHTIMSNLKAALKGKTLLFITHQPDLLAEADMVVYINESGAAAAGRHERLLHEEPGYGQFIETQIREGQ